MTKICRIYLRVSTEGQDLARQEALIEQAKAAGYYVAAVYREKASGTTTDRPALQRLLADLQPGDVLMAEKLDRITRLPLEQAEALIEQIKAKGAVLSVPGVCDLDDVVAGVEGMARIVLEGMQTMLLRLALYMARDDYETRRERQAQGIAKAKAAGKYKGKPADAARNAGILKLRAAGHSITQTAAAMGCSVATVNRVCKAEREGQK